MTTIPLNLARVATSVTIWLERGGKCCGRDVILHLSLCYVHLYRIYGPMLQVVISYGATFIYVNCESASPAEKLRVNSLETVADVAIERQPLI